MDIIKESHITESPDVTSIIQAFEEKRNPIELFFKQDFLTFNYLEENLKNIDDKLNAIDEWFNAFYAYFYERMRMDAPEYKRCVFKLSQIEFKISNFNDMFQRPYRNKHKPVSCAQCDARFLLKNATDVSDLENHKHAADILATGFSTLPQDIAVKIPPKYDDFPIQSTSKIRNHYRCLLCQVFIQGKRSVRSHCRTKSHKNKLSDITAWDKINEFVKYFQQLPDAYRVFQILFQVATLESPSNEAFCTICYENVRIDDIPGHVTNKVHRLKFQTEDYSFLNGFKEMMDIVGNIEENEEIHIDEQLKPSTSTSITNNKTNNVINKTNKSLKVAKKPKRKHRIIPSYNYGKNEKPSSMKDFIPHRFKSHLRFIEDVADLNIKPMCKLCKISVESPDEIVAHIISEQHKLKSRLEFNETLHYYCYYCCLCCKYFKKDFKWIEHLSSLTHKQKECLLPKQTLQAIFKEYECIDCSLVWYGQQHSINAHKKDKFGSGEKRWKPKEITLSHEIAKLLKDESAFAADIEKASKESTDVLNSIESAEKCCRAIEEALSFTFGDQIRAYPFGSRVSGLGNIASDLDVFVDIGSMYEGKRNQDAQFQSYCVQQTAHALRRHRNFTDVCPIPQARTPIVQVFHKPTDLDCDLSFRHGLSIENTEFLRFCINVQPKLKSLILFLKKWIRLNKFRDRISAYSIALMSIFMMQNKDYLPSLSKLREIDPQKSKIIGGWETFNFQKPISDIQMLFPLYEKSERKLLGEFFEFYVNFDYEKEVICPLLGESVSKDRFLDTSGLSLPKEMISYVNKIRANEDSERMKITRSICLQDPFDLSHNVTKAIPLEVLVKMIVLMKQSHQIIQT